MPDPRQLVPFDVPLGPAILGAAIGILLLVILVRVVRGLRERRPTPPAPEPDLSIELSRLPATGPPASGPQLSVYNIPVRLVVLVVAPAGRGGELPGPAQLANLIESLAPGMRSVADTHLPLIRRWPFQLSAQGFAQAFFSEIDLPGDQGKGSPWCALSGGFRADGKRYLAGLVCRSERPNGLGQIVVPRDEAWLDLLRVRGEKGE